MPYDVLDTTRELIEQAARLPKKTTPAGQINCQITVTNDCPEDWGVVILVGGCRFFFTDDTDYTDGPKTLDLASGESATFTCDKAEGCVHQFFLALSVKAGDEPAQSLTAQECAPDGECLLRDAVVLGVKQSVAADVLASKDLYSLLELERG